MSFTPIELRSGALRGFYFMLKLFPRATFGSA